MAKFTIKTGHRGRPLSIDTEALSQQFNRYSKKALSELASIRKDTSGIRDPGLLGTTTSAPNWWKTTLSILQEAEKGKISYSAGKELKSNIRAIQKLGSTHSKSREEALSDILYKDYIKELESQMRKGSSTSQKWLQKTKENIEKLSKQERQEFFFSKKYESPKAFGSQSYEKIRAWAKKQTGRHSMSHQEAQAYLLYRRATDGLEITKGQKREFSHGLDMDHIIAHGQNIDDIF